MRSLKEIQANWDTFMTGSQGAAELAEEQLFTDIPDMVAALAEKDAEIETWERVAFELDTRVSVKDSTITYLRKEIKQLRELSGRLEEAEYGLVAGNTAHDSITWKCADGWFYYIRTGKENTDESG